MTKQLFRCGDVVKGFPHYSNESEMGVIKNSIYHKSSPVPYQYSVNWEKTGEQSWFPETDLELVQKCLIQVRRDYL